MDRVAASINYRERKSNDLIEDLELFEPPLSGGLFTWSKGNNQVSFKTGQVSIFYRVRRALTETLGSLFFQGCHQITPQSCYKVVIGRIHKSYHI